MNKSYGGYLPIELRKGSDYFYSMPAVLISARTLTAKIYR